MPCRTSGSSPALASPARAQPPLAFHGSTIRFYDASIGAWRSTWIDPVNARVRRFVGRPVGGEIVLLSDEDDPQLRWRFTDIAPGSFTWRGEISRDGGASWTLDEEMRVSRRGSRPGLAEALHTAGPAARRAESMRLFDPFVGSWDTAWSGRDAEGRPLRARGEAHFGWALGGRALQDVWVLEGRPPAAFHGTWIRFHDASLGAWRGVWMDPVNGDVRRFVIRAEDDEILMVSDEEEPRLRWRFTDIAAESFLFRGETSRDGGSTWTLDEEMLVTRR